MVEVEEVVEDIVDCQAATLRAGEMGRLRLASELGLETTRGAERLEWVLWVGERTREGVGECWADEDMDMEDVLGCCYRQVGREWGQRNRASWWRRIRIGFIGAKR